MTPGTILANKYRVERVLGSGGMGVVLAATHLQIDEPVAIKCLHPWLAQDEELVVRFEREAKAARKIRSEHVVRILDIGTLEGGAPYMVMEYLEGADLEVLLQRTGGMPVQVAIDHLLQGMEALAEAHVQGMVHRDLKPANLFVARRADGSPLVKVLDFGISKVTGKGGAELSVTKEGARAMGSPLYMAPEQMRSTRASDARTDLWALGVILFELLAGKPPFDGESMTELCAKILQDPPPSVRLGRPDVPPDVEAAIRRCLEKDPAARFADVSGLANALAPFASPAGRFSVERIAGVFREAQGTSDTEPMAKPIAASAPALATMPTMPSVPQPPAVAPPPLGLGPPLPRPPPTPPRSVVPILSAVVGLVLAVALVAVLVLRMRRPPAETPGPETDTRNEDLRAWNALPMTGRIAFDPIGGTYGKPFDVTLSSRTEGAVLHYTTDGSPATATSPTYVGPIRVGQRGATIHALAIAAGHAPTTGEESYRVEAAPLETPLSIAMPGAFPCGADYEKASFTAVVATTGFAASALEVGMRLGQKSPFSVTASSPSRNALLVVVTPKTMPNEPEALDGYADAVAIGLPGGKVRHISVRKRGTGAIIEVQTSLLNVAAVGTTPLVLRNRGDDRGIVQVATTPGFAVTLPTLLLEPGATKALDVSAVPVGSAAEGQLTILFATMAGVCSPAPKPITLRRR